jgi:hypothetical protein
MTLTIVYTSERIGASVGRDRFGFHVVVNGVAMFGPLRSRAIAEELADTWRSRPPAPPEGAS